MEYEKKSFHFTSIVSKMYLFCDFLIFGCLFVSGFHFGYYCKYTYNDVGFNWSVLFGVLFGLVLSTVWTLRKFKKKKYVFENFYIIFYGLICSIISAWFLATKNTGISFYFIFMSLIAIYLPCYNFISLRCESGRSRPARVGFGNAIYFAGLTTGYSIFENFEAKQCAWILFGISTFAIICLIINEVLQQYRFQDYKCSCDLVFNLLNEEKLIFAPKKSILALFVGRDGYCFKRNIQWLVVGLTAILTLERCCVYFNTYLKLMNRSSDSYIHGNHFYLPYLLYTSGCILGSLLILRYKPKLIYLMFGLIKITISAAVFLSVYNDLSLENCFIFLCFYYITMGVYSSIGIQMLVEYTPFLYTELALTVSYSLELIVIEILKFEEEINESYWLIMMMIMSGITICLTISGILLTQFFLMDSCGLIEIRNRMLGIRRLPVKSYDNKLFKNNFFLQMELPPKMQCVALDNNRIFQQYPAKEDNTIKY